MYIDMNSFFKFVYLASFSSFFLNCQITLHLFTCYAKVACKIGVFKLLIYMTTNRCVCLRLNKFMEIWN